MNNRVNRILDSEAFWAVLTVLVIFACVVGFLNEID